MGLLLCNRCGMEFYRRYPGISVRTYCSTTCQRSDRTGEANPNFRGIPRVSCAVCRTKTIALYGRSGRAKEAVCCSIECAAVIRRTKKKVYAVRPSRFHAMHAGEATNTRPEPLWPAALRSIPGLDGYFCTSDGIVVNYRGLAIKRSISKEGYWRVSIVVDGRRVRCNVHRIVACTWIGPKPSPRHLVAHWDGDRSNCQVGNLRWATYSENTEDMRRHGTMLTGERNHLAKLTRVAVSEIKHLLSQRRPPKEVAATFNISTQNIYNIRKGRIWKDVA